MTIAHALFTAIFDIIFHLNNANTVPNAIKSHFGFMIHNLLSEAHEAYLNCKQAIQSTADVENNC